MNHMQSLRFEHKLYAQVKQKMEEMQQHNMSWIEVQFLKKAVDVLCQCRSTLMFTYVFAFYLKKNNQSIIFEVRFKEAINKWHLIIVVVLYKVSFFFSSVEVYWFLCFHPLMV